MDVWFDSGTSWTTLRNHTGQREGKPLADLYLEGSDQHRGWFQSSLLTSVATAADLNVPKAPFGMVVTHGFCLDEKGKKMSKSIGNAMVPADVIQPKGKDIGGIDALRLWVASCDYTKDVSIGSTILGGVNKNLRKLRVTLRFLLGNLEDWDGKEVDYSDLAKVFEHTRFNYTECRLMGFHRPIDMRWHSCTRLIELLQRCTGTCTSIGVFKTRIRIAVSGLIVE